MIHSFKFQNYNVLLDVESGAIHSIDDAAFAVVQAMEHGVNPYGVGVDAETVREVLSDLDELKTSGAFETETPTAAPTPWSAGQGRHTLLQCNIRVLPEDLPHCTHRSEPRICKNAYLHFLRAKDAP